MCWKDDIEITMWPKDVEIPFHCRRNPELCGIETKVIKRCRASMYPLDFVYDVKKKDYILENYRTDEQLVQKIQSGKGDEEERYTKLGEVIYI